MKAVLVLDEMPKDCYDCPLSNEDTIYGEHVFICTGYNAEIEDLSSRADWCPLRPLPTTEQITSLLKKGYSFMSFEELLNELSGETE